MYNLFLKQYVNRRNSLIKIDYSMINKYYNAVGKSCLICKDVFIGSVFSKQI